jgi:hypothetical protein
MKLRAFDVAFRAVQRGYTADEIRPCLMQDLGGGFFEVDIEHDAYPRVLRDGHKPSAGLRDAAKAMLAELGIAPPAAGLGDMVAAGLAAVGITKDRVSALAGGDCGCAKRQQQLNELGRRVGIG